MSSFGTPGAAMRRTVLVVAVAAILSVAGVAVPAMAGSHPVVRPDSKCTTQHQTGYVACATRTAGTPTRAQTDRARNSILARVPAASRAHRPAAAAAGPVGGSTTSVLDECSNDARSIWISDRYEACFSSFLNITYFPIGRPDRVIGEIDFLTLQYAYGATGNDWVFVASFQKVHETGDTLGSVMTGSFDCSGACTLYSADPINFSVDGAFSETFEAVYLTTINGSGQAGFATSSLTIDVNKPNYTTLGPAPVSTMPRIRCDTMFANGGCVYPDYMPPPFFVDSGLYPDVAEHIVTAQQSGAPGADIPLTRITSPNRILDNRNTACPDRPRPTGMSCDEYPFASTVEGAASNPDAGRTMPWCQIDWLPSYVDSAAWSACILDNWENVGVGSDLGQYYQDNRIIDGDRFFVEVV
jgi:hypothetical protein